MDDSKAKWWKRGPSLLHSASGRSAGILVSSSLRMSDSSGDGLQRPWRTSSTSVVGPESLRVRILDAQSSFEVARDFSLSGKAKSSILISMCMGRGAERLIMARDQETESPLSLSSLADRKNGETVLVRGKDPPK